jgi:hypothetical protein
MKVFKVTWTNIDYNNSLEYTGTVLAISSNYKSPRTEKTEFYATRELADQRVDHIKQAAQILKDNNVNTWVEEVDVKEAL